jgi:hypothetical protein
LRHRGTKVAAHRFVDVNSSTCIFVAVGANAVGLGTRNRCFGATRVISDRSAKVTLPPGVNDVIQLIDGANVRSGPGGCVGYVGLSLQVFQ